MAKVFAFRFEQLLELRRAKEDLAARELANGRQAVAECNHVSLDLMTREDEAKNDLRAMQERIVGIDLLQMASEHLAAMDRMLKREYVKLQSLMIVELEKQRLHTEARQRVRVLERLREKKELIHRQDLDLEERKFLDEIGRRTA